MKKYHIISLGCAKNLVDSEIINYTADKSEYEFTNDINEAELIIVNTCGFIESAKEESINTILEIAELKREKKIRIIATGCLVKRYFEDLKEELPEVDEFINLQDFDSFANVFNTSLKKNRKLLTPRHYAYLRISDGCNNFCSYCAIPYIRGRLKSRKIPDLINEANDLAEKGIKELIVIAQDTAQYGTDLYKSKKLAELIGKLDKIQGFEWIRLLYLHPAHLDKKIIDTIAASKKVLPYFEIPLQHINNSILDKMNRKITKKEIIGKIRYLREKIPNAIIRTTFIVGFPGESQKIFEELKEFVIQEKFERMGVFTYSPEDGTPAATFPDKVDSETAISRQDELMSIQQEISTRFLETKVGSKFRAIIDKESELENIKYEGRSYMDAPEIDGIVYITEGKTEIGNIIKVEITDAWEYDLVGKIID